MTEVRAFDTDARLTALEDAQTAAAAPSIGEAELQAACDAAVQRTLGGLLDRVRAGAIPAGEWHSMDSVKRCAIKQPTHKN